MTLDLEDIVSRTTDEAPMCENCNSNIDVVEDGVDFICKCCGEEIC